MPRPRIPPTRSAQGALPALRTEVGLRFSIVTPSSVLRTLASPRLASHDPEAMAAAEKDQNRKVCHLVKELPSALSDFAIALYAAQQSPVYNRRLECGCCGNR